jgi:hypothetical protein
VFGASHQSAAPSVSMWTKRPVHTCRVLASSRLRSRAMSAATTMSDVASVALSVCNAFFWIFQIQLFI